ncbi:hybrid sensor histidine kinase/response regulator transcription factor [Pedobacter sp.]|uniref:hybrid sensor histidine kinase/response regulator transcription factor n=1 Tax=Pedobacter sp. TaxID=1411316 RepID=UPI003D7F63A6
MQKNVVFTSAVLFVLCIVVSLQLFGKKPDLGFNTFTSKDGLSSNTVTAIIKDHLGFLWIATEDGLNRFDGTSFKVYRHISKNSSSLPTNHVTALFEDSDGTLWIGTNGGSVSIYDRNKDEFIELGKYNKEQIGVAANSITEDHKGDIWVASYSGLYVINRKTRVIKRIYQQRNFSGSLQTNTIISIYNDSRNVMWVGTDAGLYRYNRERESFTRFLYTAQGPKMQLSAFVLSLSEDKKGRILVATQGGLHVLTPEGEKIKTFNQLSPAHVRISNDIVYTVKVAKNGLVWLGTEDGLNLLSIDSSVVYQYRADRRIRSSLKAKSIRAVCFGDDGISWVGTFQGGISKFDPNYTNFKRVESNPFYTKGLSAPVVTSFAEYPGKGVFVGTDGGGVDLFQLANGIFTPNKILPDRRSASGQPFSVLALEMTRKNELWVGTYLDGVYIVNLATGNRKHLVKGNGAEHLNFNDVFCIREDKKGVVWIGTNGGGINLYDPKSGLVEKLIPNPANAFDPYTPSHLVIRALEEDRDGNMWIGTYGGGISVRNPQTERFTFYSKINNGLPSDYITSIYEDKKGNIWVGTYGGGLNLLNKKTGRFTSFSMKEGLANDDIQKIVEDKTGKLWVSTNAGISSFDPVIRKFKNYTHHNGLQNSPFVLGAGICLPDGTVFFGGQEGFNYFEPSMLRMNRNVPSVVLTNLTVNSLPVIPSDDGPLKQTLLLAKQIDLKHRDNFSISFVALNYTVSEQNRYEYRLEGVDEEWVVAGKEHTAYYTNLDPGIYKFQVRASNNDGVWNREGRTINIHISPPFWRTTYAYIFYLASIFGVILGLRYRGIKKMEMKFALEKERIEARQLIEQERRHAEHLHQMDLMKIKFLTNLSHEFRTPLSLIVGPVETLLEQIKEPGQSRQLGMIKRNGRRLMNLVNQLLDFRKMEEQELKLHLACGDIISFIRDSTDSFRDVALRKKIVYTFCSNIPSAFVQFDHDKIERILFNLLSNAFKFTPECGVIQVKITAHGPLETESRLLLDMEICDSGIGIPQESQQHLFERFFQHDAGITVLNQGAGIGLSIVKEFVKMHCGSIRLKSLPGKGSSFIVSIPFARSEAERLVVDGPESQNDMGEEFGLINQVAEPNHSGSIPSLLIVEDDDDFRFYLKDNLKSQYRIYEAADGKEGWQRALSLHPNIIVCDVNMPVMTGIELSRKLKADKRTSHIPVVLLTASRGEDEQLSGLESGANDYMTKPFNFAVLNVKLKNLLAQNQQLKDTYVKQVKVLPTTAEIASESGKFINSVLTYIEDNLHNPQLSVEAMARMLHMSRASLYTKVLEITGLSPVEFIRSVKLEKAIVLLEQSDLSIAQIAYQVGFSTPNYFARSFKAKYNMAPSEYITNKRRMQHAE